MRDAARWRAAAQAALGGAEASAPAEVERLVLDVRIGDRVEVVTLVLRDGALTAASTDGGRDVSSPFVAAALGLLARDPVAALEARASPLPSLRPSLQVPVALRVSDPPPPPRAPGAALVEALEDLATALVRTGAGKGEAPGVRDALDRIVEGAPRPLSTPLSRWLGRVERALAEGDAPLLATLVEGGMALADALRASTPSAEERARITAFLGASREDELERRVDRAYVEVARETLDGVGHGGVERRYLVDTTSGRVLREERGRGEPAPSVGPCPRVVSAGLSSVELGAATPERVRIQQYAVSIAIAPSELARVEAAALRHVDRLAVEHQSALARCPALAEPFALVAVGSVEDGTPKDAAGRAIPLAREDVGALEALRELAITHAPRWIAGRLVERGTSVAMVPCSLGTEDTILRLR